MRRERRPRRGPRQLFPTAPFACPERAPSEARLARPQTSVTSAHRTMCSVAAVAVPPAKDLLAGQPDASRLQLRRELGDY